MSESEREMKIVFTKKIKKNKIETIDLKIYNGINLTDIWWLNLSFPAQ